MKLRPAVVFAVAAMAVGCTATPSDLPETADTLTIYSLDGRDFEPGQAPTVDEYLHGYPVLGKLAVTDPAVRAEILAAVRDGVARSDGKMAKCFWPRHAVRAASDGRTYDAVICFQCLQIAYRNGSTKRVVAIKREPQEIFDKHLIAAGIKLGPKD